MTSDQNNFYKPPVSVLCSQFLREPLIKERRIHQSEKDEHNLVRRGLFGKKKKKTTTTEATTTTTDPPYYLWLLSLVEHLYLKSHQSQHPRITFKQTDIDWPSCINYIEFDYYDTVYNESVYMETLRSPLDEIINFQIVNQNAPCDGDFAHFTRVYGATGDFSKGLWTPPSCLTTTSTSTTPSGSTTTTTMANNRALYQAQSENLELKYEIGALRSDF